MSYTTPCRAPGTDPDAWFPLDEDGPGAAPARAACGRCAVRGPCLALALTLPVEGIWGATSTAERREIRRRSAA